MIKKLLLKKNYFNRLRNKKKSTEIGEDLNLEYEILNVTNAFDITNDFGSKINKKIFFVKIFFHVIFK
jgi:hypothetical protein